MIFLSNKSIKNMKPINYFNIKEFLIDPDMRQDYAEIPLHVVNKIITHHLPELNSIRYSMNEPVYVSKNSGYRSYEWELAHGRNGTSEHTFRGDGAVDITAKDMDKLVDLARKSGYKRVCYYPHHGFIHCDLKGDNYHYFVADKSGTWQYQGKRR